MHIDAFPFSFNCPLATKVQAIWTLKIWIFFFLSHSVLVVTRTSRDGFLNRKTYGNRFVRPTYGQRQVGGIENHVAKISPLECRVDQGTGGWTDWW